MWPECSTNILTWQSSYAHIFFQPFFMKKINVSEVYSKRVFVLSVGRTCGPWLRALYSGNYPLKPVFFSGKQCTEYLINIDHIEQQRCIV